MQEKQNLDQSLAMSLLSSFSLASTNDPEEAQAVLSRQLSDLRFESVQSRRSFQLEMNGIRLGRSLIAYNRFGTGTEVHAGRIESAVIVSFCVGPPSVVTLDSESVGPNSAAITSPSRRLSVRRTSGSGMLFVRADYESLERRMRELTGIVARRPIVFDRSLTIDGGPAAQLRRILESVSLELDTDPTILNNPLLRSGIDDMLLNAMLALPHNYRSNMQDCQPADLGSRLVRKAEAYLETHAVEPITISDIVEEFGCSRSALFAAFRRHRGYTPMQFLLECRLQSARTALGLAKTDDSIASIAKLCGFLHVGRFSVAYRKRFGESPSETVRRV